MLFRSTWVPLLFRQLLPTLKIAEPTHKTYLKMTTSARSTLFLTTKTREKLQNERYGRFSKIFLKFFFFLSFLPWNRWLQQSNENGFIKPIWFGPSGPPQATCRAPVSPVQFSLFRTPIQVNFMSFSSVFAIWTQPRSPFLQTPA